MTYRVPAFNRVAVATHQDTARRGHKHASPSGRFDWHDRKRGNSEWQQVDADMPPRDATAKPSSVSGQQSDINAYLARRPQVTEQKRYKQWGAA